MSLTIKNLFDKPEYIDLVVDLLYEEWGDKTCNNRSYWNSWVRSSLSTTDVPQTYIVFDNNIFIGTFSIWRCDLQSRQDVFPWLGGFVIVPEQRHKGYSPKIQYEALEKVKMLGYNDVYMFTYLGNYYDKFGWSFIEIVPDEKGKEVRLYKYNLRNINRKYFYEEV